MNPLAPEPPHFPAKANHVIFLLMNGGVSHVDTFDPKPALDKYDGQPLPGGNPKTERKTGNLMRSPFQFRQYGKSGLPVSDVFPHVAQCIDDICVVRSVYTDIPNHELPTDVGLRPCPAGAAFLGFVDDLWTGYGKPFFSYCSFTICGG